MIRDSSRRRSSALRVRWFRRRSVAMWLPRFWARVRRRLGIIRARSTHRSRVGTTGLARLSGAQRLGNSNVLPGVVVSVCPEGEVRITVPSGNC